MAREPRDWRRRVLKDSRFWKVREGFPVVVLLIMMVSGCDASLGWPKLCIVTVRPAEKKLCIETSKILPAMDLVAFRSLK